MLSSSIGILSMPDALPGLTDGLLDLFQRWAEVKVKWWLLWDQVESDWVNSRGSIEEVGEVSSPSVQDAAFILEQGFAVS